MCHMINMHYSFEYLCFPSPHYNEKSAQKNTLWRVSSKSSGEKCCLSVDERAKHKEKKYLFLNVSIQL